jgi:hypothetical protein
VTADVRVVRLGLIAGVAVGLGAGGTVLRSALGDGETPAALAVLTGLIVGAVAGWFATTACTRVLAVAGRALRWARAHPATLRRLRAPALAAATLVAGLSALLSAFLALRAAGWRVDPAAVQDRAGDAALALLPAALVLLLGLWLASAAAALAARLARRRRPGPPGERFGLADGVRAIVLGADLFLLLNRDLLGTQAVTLLVVPALLLAGVATWRAMSRSPRLPVRAGADIVLSLVVGGDLVFLLVWLANLLDLQPAEVAALRGSLERVGAVADVPWWAWTLLYAALAAASLTLALRPERLEAAIRWSTRLRVLPAVDAGRRTVQGLHIALLATSLIGLAGPPAVAQPLRAQVRERYAVALQQEFDAAGERAAYDAVRASASGGPLPATGRQALQAVLTRVHEVAGSRTGSAATKGERDLARSVGEFQARTLGLHAAAPVLAGEPAMAELRSLDRPPRDSADLHGRLDRLEEREQEARDGREQLQQAAELAAVALASATQVQVPGLGDSALVQVLREYLAGIVESSPVKEVFFEWARRLWFERSEPEEPPPASRLALPDPLRLRLVATLEVTRLQFRLISAGAGTPDRSDPTWLDEAPAAGAVDAVVAVRVTRARLASCCVVVRGRTGESERLRERRPARPIEPVRPRGRI